MPTLSEIATLLGRPVEGNGDILFARASEPSTAGAGDLALAMAPHYGEALMDGGARVAILWDGADYREFGLEGAVTVPRARLAMAGITRALDPGPDWGRGIHPSAVIHPDATLGTGATVGALAVIGPGAVIGANAQIGPQVCVEADATIGSDALIHARAVIGARVTIGDRFTCQPGAVIGGDGFSFTTEHPSTVEEARRRPVAEVEARDQQWVRIHSLGAVRIGDDVEVGANTAIDRGTVIDTQIGDRTKIDNLVHIGHNVVVGEDCLLCGQVGIAGSVTIGRCVVLAGQVGVNDNTAIGDFVVATGGTDIFAKVPGGSVLQGSPALALPRQRAMDRAVRRLPALVEEVAALRKIVSGLRDGTDHDDS